MRISTRCTSAGRGGREMIFVVTLICTVLRASLVAEPIGEEGRAGEMLSSDGR